MHYTRIFRSGYTYVACRFRLAPPSKLIGQIRLSSALPNVQRSNFEALKEYLQRSDAEKGRRFGELTIDQPLNAKLVRIAILGLPNAGKSSIANALVGNQVLPVSRKVHTTRKLTTAVAVERETQMIFLDTPGVISSQKKKEHHLEQTLLIDPEKSIPEADVIAVIVDASNKFANKSIDHRILYLLNRYSHKGSFLILNKVDEISDKTALLEIMHSLTGGFVGGQELPRVMEAGPVDPVEMKQDHWGKTKDRIELLMEKYHREPASMDGAIPKSELTFDRNVHELSDIQLSRYFAGKGCWPSFEQVFMVSATKGVGLAELRTYLVSKSKSRDWLYPDTVTVDQKPTDFILPIIRSKLLDKYDGPLPYVVKLSVGFGWLFKLFGLIFWQYRVIVWILIFEKNILFLDEI